MKRLGLNENMNGPVRNRTFMKRTSRADLLRNSIESRSPVGVIYMAVDVEVDRVVIS